ncbi:hypothetical protein [Candidatus Poriferisodalis sp.]|uniref:hypothetical protein n=1 Tax=Candidatus Poriferisodalis sp. TaxID=3101277 RepID=UPI003B026FDF
MSRPEARRRLARLPEMEALLAELHAAELHRTAGWGIDHAVPGQWWGRDTEAIQGDSFVAWLWLTGDGPPSAGAEAVAAGHDDVEIRFGASASYAALAAARARFADGFGVFLPRDAVEGDEHRFALSDAVAGVRVDHRLNLLAVEVDERWVARDDAWALLGRDPFSDGRPAEDELLARIAEELQDLIDVPFAVVAGWKSGHN